MSQTLTISAPLAMSAVPALLVIGGIIVGWFLRADLATSIEAARLVARNDEQAARWLWKRGYRSTPHAGPDITPEPLAIEADDAVNGEVLHVEHATGPLPVLAEACCDGHDSNECNGYGELSEACCEECPDWDNTPQPNPLRTRALSDRPAEDEDEVGEEQPGESWPWWMPLALTAAVLAVAVLLPVWVLWLFGEWAWGKALAFVEYLDDRFKTDAARAREWEQVEGGPWSWEDEQRAQGVAEQVPPTNPTYKSHRCPHGAVAKPRDPSYEERHVAKGYETAAYPVIDANVPAPRNGGDN